MTKYAYAYMYAPPDQNVLTHLLPDKMTAIVADDIFKCIFLNENDRISNQISLKLVARSPIDNKAALVLVMAWRQNRRQAITWINDDPIHWRIYAALGGDEAWSQHGLRADPPVRAGMRQYVIHFVEPTPRSFCVYAQPIRGDVTL